MSAPATAFFSVSLNGVTNFVIPYAEAKVFKLIGATNSAIDGFAGFGTGIGSNSIVGVALHEFTHALGRVPGADVLSLFRYTSVGTHYFGNGLTAPATYFSIDGGKTKLADFGQASDPSDFLNSSNAGGPGPFSSLTPNDSFDEIYIPGTTLQSLTAVDLTMLDMLGFGSPSAPPPPSTASNLLWQNNSTGMAISWTMQGVSAVASSVFANLGTPAWQLEGSGNFADGTSDTLWQNSVTGLVIYWTMQGASAVASTVLANLGPSWRLAGDVNFGDGTSDVLWQNTTTGQVNYWTMQGGSAVASHLFANLGTPTWQLVGSANFGDGTSDILWQNTQTSQVVYWTMQGASAVASHVLTTPGVGWQLVGTTNFGDGTSDILWQYTPTGEAAYWTMQGGSAVASTVLANLGPSWRLAGPLPLTSGSAATAAAASVVAATDAAVSDSTGTGATTVVGAAGDMLTAGSGELINALAGSQAIFGGSGHATVWGGGYGDTITGGPGQLAVDIDHANYPGSVLVGDNGAKGDTTVTGFSQSAGDRLFFQNQTSASITSVLASAQSSGGNTLITLPDGATMTLLGSTKIDHTFFA